MAHDYVIISDATCNLPKQFYEDDFAIIPMDVIIDGKAYDADTLSKKEFYDKMRAGVFPSTSLINTTTAIDFFTPYLEKGQDVFFICFSSKLSGSFKSVTEAGEELLERFPDRRICIIDSKSASGGEGMLVYYCLKNAAKAQVFRNLSTLQHPSATSAITTSPSTTLCICTAAAGSKNRRQSSARQFR